MSDEETEKVDGYDPGGVELALSIAHEVAGILPPPRGVKKIKKHWAPKLTDTRKFTGSGADPRDPQPIGKVLSGFISAKGWRSELGVRNLIADWPRLVGDVIAEHSKPTGFKDKVLYVQAESTTWASALRMLASQVVARLNEELGQNSVERIEIRGPWAPSWSHGPRSVRDGRGPRDTYG